MKTSVDTPPPPTTISGSAGGGGGNERITVSLVPKAVAALESARKITGESKTDCVNRALQLYAMMHEVQAAKGEVRIRDTPDADLVRIRVL